MSTARWIIDRTGDELFYDGELALVRVRAAVSADAQWAQGFRMGPGYRPPLVEQTVTYLLIRGGSIATPFEIRAQPGRTVAEILGAAAFEEWSLPGAAEDALQGFLRRGQAAQRAADELGAGGRAVGRVDELRVLRKVAALMDESAKLHDGGEYRAHAVAKEARVLLQGLLESIR